MSVAYFSDKIEDIVGEKIMIFLMPATVLCGILTLIFSSGFVAVYIGYLLIEISFGLQGAVLNKYLQQHLETKYRSTVESLQWFYSGLYSAIILFIAGFITQASNIHYTFAFIFIISLALLISPTYFLIKDAKSSKSTP